MLYLLWYVYTTVNLLRSQLACGFKVTVLAVLNNVHILIRAIRLRHTEIDLYAAHEASRRQAVHLRRTDIKVDDEVDDIFEAGQRTKLLKHRKNLERSTRTMRGICQ